MRTVSLAFLPVILALTTLPCTAEQYLIRRGGDHHSSCTKDLLDDPQLKHLHTSDMLVPYTTPWVTELQAIYNTKGIFHNYSDCPEPVPAWTCQPYMLSETERYREPKDVWHLRPHNIKAIISMGDSITAGFAMQSGRPPLATLLEYRGKVFSDGGDDNEHTLANFLRTFRQHVNGSPLGVTLPLAQGKGLNTAVSGAIAQSLPAQVERLRRQFSRRGGRYHKYRDEWKLVTLFIGANNLCAACNDPTYNKQVFGDSDISEPYAYRAALMETLRDLKGAIGGKAFVNLVGIFDVTLVYDQSRGYPYCEMLFDMIPISICSCATGSDENRKKAGRLARQYNVVMQEVAEEINRSMGRDGQFGVVYQPGLTEFKQGAAGYGQGYLSGFDCFHPNKCANQLMAISIWNNMLTPTDEKDTPMDPENAHIKCPGPNDYLQ